jgi:DNA-binding MarR family transcriptional regulator/GNAT superfamily N-acetyltransferase
MPAYTRLDEAVDRRAIAAVREYNRFYTQRLGLLNDRVLGSPWSLTEARLVYEIAQRRSCTASELARDLRLDPGYLSRLLRRFEGRGLIERQRCESDARRSFLQLTASGREAFAALERGSSMHVARLLEPLDAGDRASLVAAMTTIHGLLGESGAGKGTRLSGPETSLRAPCPGDLGWVVERHGALYAAEFGYDDRFEGLVARIVADFLGSNDPARERCWIAEHGGRRVGAVLLVRVDDDTAKLRLLFVEPDARGLGIGARLVGQCTEFARGAGYKRITLWTQSHLAAARKLYLDAGYMRIAETPHRSFGQDLVAETWELVLGD